MNVLCNLVVLSLLAAAAPPRVVEFYQYVDEQGRTVLSQAIPAELAYKGYTVLDGKGQVLRVVPRQLTDDEIRERDAKAAAARAEDERTRKRSDEELLKLYATPEDVESARDRKLKAIDGEIMRVKAEIERLTQQKSKLERQGAERERAGQAPSAEIIANLKVIDTHMQDRQSEIAAREAEKEQQRANFQYDLERMRTLLGPGKKAAGAQAAGKKTPAASSGH